MRVLVVQTTRMGDVIQTTPLIRRIRAQHPDAHIAVMVRRMGKTIAEHNPDINEVIVYDEDELYVDMRSRDSERLLKAYETADARVQSLRDARFDVAYNVTHSIASAMLLKLAEIPEVIGAHLSDDWQFVLRGAWTTYFFTSVFSREYNDLNLCDISRQFAHDAPPSQELVFEVGEEDRAYARDLLRANGVEAGGFVACMQLGASETNKRWAERRFAELAALLKAQYGATIFLVGVEEEAPLGEAFAEHAPGLAVPLFGKTSIPQLAALLEQSSILVTNDTGTMHLAAAVGCPVTLVSVGHVHYRETGPYGEGHCAIEWRRASLGRSDYVPGALEEREQIRAEQVLLAVEITLAAFAKPGASPPQMPERAGIENIDLLMTRFAPDGCLQFYPLIRRPMSLRDFLRTAYRAMWLDHLSSGDKKTETRSLREFTAHFDGPSMEIREGWQKETQDAFRGLAALAQRGVRMTEALLGVLKKGKGMGRAKQLVTQLMALDEESRVYAELHPACRPLILLARFERDNLEGADPLVLAETTLAIYRACYQRARLMARKADRVLEVWASSETA